MCFAYRGSTHCLGILMNTEKLSISLPSNLSHFIAEYQLAHACKSRSEVIQKALKLLQKRELAKYYREASQEIDPLFEITTSDGLNDETW